MTARSDRAAAEPTIRTLSLGAGVQSTTLLLLALEGALPTLDCGIFADTGGEPRRVYDHLDMLTARAADVGVPVLRVSNGNLRDDSIDPGHRYASIPYFVRNPDGTEGMGRRQCTSEYKLAPIRRKVRELLGATAPDFRRVPKGRVAEQWIGFSTDEIGRVSDHDQVSYIAKRYPLLELGMSRKDCERWLRSRGWTSVTKSACTFCFAYETEVITPEGAKPIGSLVGDGGLGKATLLIPLSRNGWASWREVEVRSFGVQRLWRLNLARGRSVKTIYVTAGHRWKTRDRKTGCWSTFVTTADLRPGDVLPMSRAQVPWASRNKATPSPFGIAAGFTFGDGERSVRPGRAASVNFYDGKDEPMVRFFPNCTRSRYKAAGGTWYTHIGGLPRAWKDAVPLSETRGYLLGWLAGYFAADGTVSEKGQATLFSARRAHIAHVRDACYVLGVRTSPLLEKTHPAIGGMATIYSVTLNIRDLPASFWLMPHHAERITRKLATTVARDTGWAVLSAEPTNREEEVYCAVVPGEEMFVLADNLVTGNCPYHGNRQWRDMRDNHPDEWAGAVEFDRQIRNGGARGLPLDGQAFLHRSRVPLDIAPIDRVTSAEWKSRQGDLLDVLADEEGDPDGCSPYGCRSGPRLGGAA